MIQGANSNPNKAYLDFVGQFEKYFLNQTLDNESL
jgi:vacuolar-type H+-ATPase subunit B/Vma2